LESPHLSVLKNEVLEIFAPLSEGCFIDCTLGFGGHSEAILKAHPKLSLIGIDQDPHALEFSQKRLAPFKDRFSFREGRFSEVLPTLKELPIAGILADIGVSSLQLDDSSRGFSFHSERLDMRMNPNAQLSALEVVNSYPQDRLERIFKEYGEIKESKKLVSLISEERKKGRITSAEALSRLIERHFKRVGNIHPATLAFQAIRIEVNDELGEIGRALQTIGEIAKGRVSIISFHSLEDRLVKNFFKEWSNSCLCPPEAFRCTCGNNHEKGQILTKKPLVATPEESKANPRSRSAKMRAFEFKS